MRRSPRSARAAGRDRPAGEGDIQRFLLDGFAEHGLVTHHPPIVAADAHSADPHYETPSSGGAPIGRRRRFVLIDLWAKEPSGVYADITWTGFVGDVVPPRHAAIFEIVRRARDAGVAAVRGGVRAPAGTLRGCDVDGGRCAASSTRGGLRRTASCIAPAIRSVSRCTATARTSMDSRRRTRAGCLPNTCFSIGPGIYLPGEFGVRE